MGLAIYLCFVLLSGCLTCVLFLVGYVAPYWTWIKEIMDTHTGLWQWCRKSTIDGQEMCGIIEFESDEWPTWLKAAQGLLSASLFCALLALVVTVIWAFKGPKKATCIAACVLYILAGILSLVGASVYGAEIKNGLHWAFAFPIVAAVLYVVPAVLSAVAAHKVEQEPDDKA